MKEWFEIFISVFMVWADSCFFSCSFSSRLALLLSGGDVRWRFLTGPPAGGAVFSQAFPPAPAAHSLISSRCLRTGWCCQIVVTITVVNRPPLSPPCSCVFRLVILCSPLFSQKPV